MTRSRRRGGHPWLFMLAVGTCAAAIVHGDVASAIVAGLGVAWTLR